MLKQSSVSRALLRSFALLVAALLLSWGLPTGRVLAAGDPAVEGEWSSPRPWPVCAIHASLLPTGKVLAWEWGQNGFRGTGAVVWDPGSGGFTPAPFPQANFFCGGHALLPDGRLFAAGGPGRSRRTAFFDPQTGRWKRGRGTKGARYYPSVAALPNGEALVIAGLAGSRANMLPQVLTASGSWRNLTGAVRDLHYYPFLHVAPNGKVFVSGPMQATSYLDPEGKGAWTPVALRGFGYRDYGASVLYDDGKVLTLGGHDPPTATAEVIDLSAPEPRWRAVPPMARARRHLNATLLPDGTVLVTGGTSGAGENNPNTPVLQAEIWDPEAETFRPAASALVPRMYHSTALLLPDGRVLAAGGEEGAAAHYDGEIYSPPYLFRGPRPRISSLPAAVRYGETFTAATPDAADIGAVTWLRPGSVTHALDMNQRINRLGFTPAAGGLRITAPGDPNLCPPGDHMLFLLNRRGVPSEARFVRIH